MKTRVTSIYLSPEDRAELEEAAKKAGMPLTTYIKKAAKAADPLGVAKRNSRRSRAA